MKPQNLLIVTRRFWPHSGLTEIALSELAVNLAKAGHEITIATIQWSRHWSECVHYQGIPVIRFARPVSGPWSSFRYSRSLARHFTTTSYDGVIVAGMDDEAAAVMKTVDETTPALIYVDDGHLGTPTDLTRKQIDILKSADAVVASNPRVADALSGIRTEFVETIFPGIGQAERKTDDRSQIRAGLAKAHQILSLEANQRLVVCCTRMDRRSRISELIAAWPSVLRHFPNARLWLIGEGKITGCLWQQIVDLDLVYSILLPGFFDQLADVFGAANLYVHAGGPHQCGEALVRAMACGTPAMAIANQHTSKLITNRHNGILSESSDFDSIATAIIEALHNDNWTASAATLAKNQLANQYLPERQVAGYVDLIKSLSDQLVEAAL